jgi:ComF family protein
MNLDTRARVCNACIALIERVHEPICQKCGVLLQPGGTPGQAQRSQAKAMDLLQGQKPAMRIDARQDASDRCRACTESPPHFGRARAVARYRPGISEDGQVVPSIIRRHKYGGDQSLSRALIQCLGDSLPLNGNDYDLVIPVPLHPRRLQWRGFNQAALLGVEVARRLGCTVDVATLARVRNTPPQTMQHGAERRRNVRGAFVVTRPQRIANRRLLLVDDVMTTGATLNECARILLAAGARKVDVFTLARAV